ncbi:MAG: ankyrin repeat domain-containing protein [Desulfovibrio sp.]|nr:ankyrin repeat domain-containing protein [Desulfovibrio sp.]
MRKTAQGRCPKRHGVRKRFWRAMSCAVLALLALRGAGYAGEAFLPRNDFVKFCAVAGPGEISAALAAGADPNAVWTGSSRIRKTGLIIYEGDSALTACAAHNPNLASVRVLLDAGARVNDGNMPLFRAIRRERADIVALLLQRGADPNAGEPRGAAVHHAAERNSEIFTLLAQAGADLRVTSRDGETTLHFAARNEDAGPLRLLLAAGLDPNATDQEGDTPLHGCVLSPLVVTALAEAGADVNRKNNAGRPPFAEVRDQDVLNAFLAAGARPVWGDGKGRIRVIRAFFDSNSGHSRPRFFAVNPQILPSPARAFEDASPLQRTVLAGVVLEEPLPAEPDETEKYSEKICFVAEGGNDPINFLPYYLETRNGAVLFGRSGKDGCAARLYTPGPEELKWRDEEEAIVAADSLLEKGGADSLSGADSAGSALRYGEIVCFAHPGTRLPVVDYPYFVLSPEGYAMAGRSGEDGCSAELFTPPSAGGAFRVYGGIDALGMNVKGPRDPGE